MVKYNYLKGNESEFPHISNVNTYKYDNDFDYGRFDAPQMELQICTVPWDMGEAHIGNRTISGIGNVVYFETKEKRDEWFDAIPDSECYRFTTKFKELHRSLEIDVPIPYDMCAKHNYLVVRYAKFANEDSPIDFEGYDGLREWFWFIREVEFLAPSTTRLHLLDDAFQTWIYDINVSSMVLERGHAPMFAMKADEYLQNPLENNEYLLTDDVNFGDASQVQHIDALVLNINDIYACVATTADVISGSWDWNVPAKPYYLKNGLPSLNVFAMPAGKLEAFLTYVTVDEPQFKQTVQGIFFASGDLLTIGKPFTFARTQCFEVSSTRKTFELCDLTKNLFGYDSRYANLAKLYTSPYAHIEVTDENGNVDIVKIEDSSGTINVNAVLSLAYPFITINANLLGVGGSANKVVSFKNVTTRTFNMSGQWYETLRTWQVPTFAVVLDPAREYDYSTRFDRAQAVTDYTAAYNNAYASADTITANAAISSATNSAITTASNAGATQSATISDAHNFTNALNTNLTIGATADSTIAANEMQATIGAASNAVSGAVGAIGAAATGNVAGAVTGAINALVGSAATMASMQVANGLTATQAGIQQSFNTNQATVSNNTNDANADNQISVANSVTSAQNSQISGQAANNAATQKANATRTRNAAQSAIDNGIAQAALRSPFMYGNFANGDNAASRPIGLFAHIVTQSKSAIAGAGDEFLRYGYQLERQWDFDGNWNIGKYFTYWKLRDFWVSNLNVPDMYMDKIRFFLFGGVTIWRKPEYIGHVNVYDNFNG